MKLLGISGALIGAKTAISVNEVLTKAGQHPHIETELFDLKDYKVEFVDGRPFVAYNEDTRTVINKIIVDDSVNDRNRRKKVELLARCFDHAYINHLSLGNMFGL
ncbi:hypothetical protein ACIQZI_17850 [Peribacillus sp. NPDC096379]|uniref:hypothetical protein n=1 Tax=Peribacillus sp. NPDC096379 TaxID=3364393 RepID=UPI0038006544